jgi:putative peptidoglycan lipid II flippase
MTGASAVPRVSLSAKQRVDTRMRSANVRIGTAMALVGVLTFVVAAVGALRDVVVASQFGPSGDLDAFLVAFLLPSFAVSVLAGALATAFMPTYVHVLEHDGEEAAQELFSSVGSLAAGSLTAASILLVLGGYYLIPLIGSGFSTSQLALGRTLFLIMVPILVIRGVASIWGAALHANERFALVAATPVLVPLFAIVLLLLTKGHWGVYPLAIGVVLGYAAEAGVLAYGLRRRGLRLRLRWNGLSRDVRNVLGQYFPMLAGATLMSSTAVVDQAMAAALEPGSVSLLHFGSKLGALVIGVGSMALGSALLPHYSRMVAQRDWAGISGTVRTYGLLIVFTSVPLVGLFIYLREPMIGLLFERGAFSTDDTRRVAQVHMYYAAQIPFYLLGTLLVRLAVSLNASWILLSGAAINLPLNVMLNYIFMHWLGVAGIALSTAVVYFVAFCFTAAMLFATRQNQFRWSARPRMPHTD